MTTWRTQVVFTIGLDNGVRVVIRKLALWARFLIRRFTMFAPNTSRISIAHIHESKRLVNRFDLGLKIYNLLLVKRCSLGIGENFVRLIVDKGVALITNGIGNTGTLAAIGGISSLAISRARSLATRTQIHGLLGLGIE